MSLRVHPAVEVIKTTSLIDDTAVINFLHDVQYYVAHQFEHDWGVSCTFYYEDFPGTGVDVKHHWQLIFMDTSDQAGALGYHWLTDWDTPQMKVFVADDKKYGYNWQVTATHEIFEALVDPYCGSAYQSTNTQFYGYEVGDPVESDSFAKKYGAYNTMISDYVLPSWFDPQYGQAAFDAYGHTTKALDVLAGGYVSIYENGQWTQKQMQKGELVAVPLEKDNPRFRDRNA